MKEILIVGIGSRIMMDDGIGVYLVEDLKDHIESPDIEFIIGETDFDYCISEVSGGNPVVVIDAFLSGKAAGEVTVIPLCDLEKGSRDSYSLHGLHFFNVIESLKHELEGIMIGIEPCEINFGFSLSDRLQSSYAHIFEAVCGYVNKYIEQCGGIINA